LEATDPSEVGVRDPGWDPAASMCGV